MKQFKMEHPRIGRGRGLHREFQTSKPFRRSSVVSSSAGPFLNPAAGPEAVHAGIAWNHRIHRMPRDSGEIAGILKTSELVGSFTAGQWAELDVADVHLFHRFLDSSRI